MPIDPQLLEILVCPDSRQPLRRADDALIARLNGEIQSRRLRNRSGEIVDTEIREGLVREDGRFFYVVDDDIAIMLIEKSIELQ